MAVRFGVANKSFNWDSITWHNYLRNYYGGWTE